MPVPSRPMRVPPRFWLLPVFLAGMLSGALMNRHDGSLPSARGHEPTSQPMAVPTHWLDRQPDRQRDQLERHLRGLDVAMMEIGNRFNELYFAGRDGNWPYARYQIEKIELALQLALERRPMRAASAQPFLKETLPRVKQAIQTAAGERRPEIFTAAMDRLRTDCMKCHVAEDVSHFTVHFPESRASTIHPGEKPNPSPP